jgi:hypothetical protein
MPPRSTNISGSHPASARDASTPTSRRLFPGIFFPPWQLRNLGQSHQHIIQLNCGKGTVPHFLIKEKVRILHCLIILRNESILRFLRCVPIEEGLELIVHNYQVFGISERIGPFVLAF